MQMTETRTVTARDGRTFTVRRLRLGDDRELQAFNAGLRPESERWFRCHAYDDATVAKVLARSEAGEDLILGVFDGPRIIAYFFFWYFRNPVPLLGIGLQDNYQGSGLARQMMELLVAEARAAGRDGVELTTMLQNHRAYALYEKVGFKYWGDVENVQANGITVIERAMYYAIKPGSQPPKGRHAPPV